MGNKRADSNLNSALGTALAYAVLGGIWILYSDAIVEWWFKNPDEIILASMLKGWLFIAVTTLLLYRLMRRRQAGEGSAALAEVDIEHASRIPLARLRLPFTLFLLAIVVMGGMALRYAYRQHQEKAYSSLRAIADLKAQQTADWLAERAGDARLLRESPVFPEEFRRWQAGDVLARDRLRQRLNSLSLSNGFDAATLASATGEPVLVGDQAVVETAPELGAAVRAAHRAQAVRIFGPYRGADGRVGLSYLVPYAGAAAPVLLLHANLQTWFDAVLRSWPMPSDSAEILLLRPAGAHMQILNAARHRQDTALQAAGSLGDAALQAAHGRADQRVYGSDYRGVAVVGVARAVPASDWILLAKMDVDELSAIVLKEVQWMGLAVLLALFIAAAGMTLLRQRQHLAIAESIRASQAERLRALKLLAAIAEHADEAIYAKDLEGRYILFNRAAERMTGLTAEDALGRDDRALFTPPLLNAILEGDRAILAANATRRCEREIPRAAGMLTAEVTEMPLQDASGRPIGLFGIARDISERKSAEQALRESEARFHDIVRASADWIWEMDAQGRFTYVSDSVEDLLGYAPAEVLGKTPFDLMPADEAARLKAEFAAIAAARRPFRDLDNINLRKDGTRCHVQSNGMPILGAQGELLGYRGLDRDVTAQKQAEQALRDSEARWIMAIDSAGHGVWDWSQDTNKVFYSPNWKSMLGYAEDEIGDGLEEWTARVHPDDIAHCLAELERHYRGESETYICTHRMRCKDGRYKWILDQGRVVARDPQGKPARAIGTHTDISQTKAVEEELRRKTAELAERNAELERFNRATVGRELDMVELKKQVNALARELGREPPYRLDFLQDPDA